MTPGEMQWLVVDDGGRAGGPPTQRELELYSRADALLRKDSAFQALGRTNLRLVEVHRAVPDTVPGCMGLHYRVVGASDVSIHAHFGWMDQVRVRVGRVMVEASIGRAHESPRRE